MTEHFEHLGYLAVLIGAFLEGETILVLAGFAAHRGYLRLQWVVCAAFVGSFLGDQFFFYLGRRYGLRLFSSRPRWQAPLEKGRKLVERYRLPILLSFRFLYGLRIALPVALGMSSIRARTFLFFNVVGAVVWAFAIGGAGYLFGQGLERLIGRVERFELFILVGVALAGLSVRVVHAFWKHRKPEGTPGSQPKNPSVPGRESSPTGNADVRR